MIEHYYYYYTNYCQSRQFSITAFSILRTTTCAAYFRRSAALVRAMRMRSLLQTYRALLASVEYARLPEGLSYEEVPLIPYMCAAQTVVHLYFRPTWAARYSYSTYKFVRCLEIAERISRA